MQRRHIYAYDTIRFLSIMAIIAYHYYKETVTGGFLAVDTFFILSGMLITEHLENMQQKEWGYLHYLYRRLSKLFWPMVTLMVVCLPVLLIFRPQLLVNLRPTIWGSLFFVNNLVQIKAGNSYFANFLHPSIFTHLWFLSLYAQMVLLWVLFFKWGRPRFKNRSHSGYFMLAIALLSAFIMGILYQPGEDPTRVYYGLDTRLFSFALGGAATQLAIADRIKARLTRVRLLSPLILYEGIILLTLVISVYLLFVFTDTSVWTYRGGMFLFDLILTVALALLSRPNCYHLRFLTIKIGKWLGERSYFFYLWYYPVFILFFSGTQNNNFYTRSAVLQIVTILIIGVISYGLVQSRWITDPLYIRKKQEPLRIKSAIQYLKKKTTPIQEKMSASVITLLLLLSIVAVVIAPTEQDVKTQTQQFNEQQQENLATNEQRASSQDQNRTEEKADSLLSTNQLSESEREEIKAYYNSLPEDDKNYISAFTEEQYDLAYQLPITFIGDSLTVGASKAIYALFPKAIVDARIGLQMYDAASFIQSTKEQGQLFSQVVLDLGANGNFKESQLDDVIQTIGDDKHIYLVNTHVNRPWKDEVNIALKKKAESDPKRFTYIDWNQYFSTSAESASWLEPDKTHLNVEGNKNWLDFVAGEILKSNVS